MDAYEAIMQIRADLGETAEAHWTDLALLRRLNIEQRRVASKVMLQAGDWLLTSGDITITSGEGTLPSACAKPIYLETDGGDEVPVRGLREVRYDAGDDLTSFDSTFYTAYLKGNTLVVSSDSASGTWTLWYYKKVRELAYGLAGTSSGASALHFEAANQPSQADDYYSSAGVNTYDASTGARKLSTTITDYAGATLVATVTGTPASGDAYGTESELCDEAMDVALQQTLLAALANPASALDPKYFEFHREVLKDYQRTFANWLETRMPGSRAVRISRRDNG